MLSFNQQYNISHGIFYAFQKGNTKKLLSVNHKKETKDKVKQYFPHYKFEEASKQNFVLVCLYVMYKHSPSSSNSMIDYLRDVDLKDVYKFKEELVNYEKYVNEDIKYLIDNNIDINYESMFGLYTSSEIKWYTFYFYLLYSNQIELIENSRLNKHIYENLKNLLKYITFKQEKVEKIKSIIEEKLIKL